ncbi:MAG: putative LPS assembly protein LptD [Bdellovibrionia bacterium]
MPLPRRIVTRIELLLISVLCLLALWDPSLAWALGESQPIHFSGDKQVWDRKSNKVELFGHAAVNQLGETLTADYVQLDLNTRLLDAKGNCIYLASDSVIYGEEMHFNLQTHTGTVIKGRVTNDSFTLRGERISKLGAGHFVTHWGDYTTCHDCGPSWSFEAEDVDMEFGGYAYLHNVTTRVKEAPMFWLPYLIVPMKTRRQTGLLFPIIRTSGSDGATFVFPFFWAINRSMDMTIGLGDYSQRGARVETETRYSLSPGSSGTIRAFYMSDRSFPDQPNRWALDITQSHEFPWGIEQKLRLSEVSDNLYPYMFPADVPGSGEAFQSSYLAFSKGSADVSGFMAFQRYRNLLNSAPGDPVAQKVNFDQRTVQALPSALLTTNDKFLWDTPFVGGITVGFENFTRAAGPFDYDASSLGLPFGTAIPLNPPPFRPGIDPIREATRISVTPSIYTAFRPFDVLSVMPSLQYRGFFYNFGGLVPNLNRGYLLFQTDLSAQLERVFEFPDDPDVPRAKHLIRPILTYSYIPWVIEDPAGHPFLSQISNAQKNNITGYNFDDNDIVPIGYTRTGANYFVPLGNSLAYGFNTQWVRRRGAVNSNDGSYQRAIEFSAGQAVNFKELTNPVDPSNPQPLTRFFSVLNLGFDRFSSSTTYNYYPDLVDPSTRHTISTSASWILERATHQRILTFDRSINLGYSFYKGVNAPTSNLSGSVNFSLSDYVLPTGTVSYSFVTNQLLGAYLGMQLQSPSRCWRFSTGLGYTAGRPGLDFTFEWSLNLTGSGFGGVTDFASQLVPR